MGRALTRGSENWAQMSGLGEEAVVEMLHLKSSKVCASTFSQQRDIGGRGTDPENLEMEGLSEHLSSRQTECLLVDPRLSSPNKT